MKTLHKLWRGALDVIFPKRPETLKLEHLAEEDMAGVLPEAPKSLEHRGIFPLFDYHNERVRSIIWEIKYKGNPTLADFAADALHDRIFDHVAEKMAFNDMALPVIIPVPISRERRRSRGFNQTELIAGAINRREIGKFATYMPNALTKIRHTPPQTELDRSAREKNLAGAYHVPYPAFISGRSIILIDDVVTTGSTIEEARRTLLAAGARDVVAFTIAH